MAAGKVKVLLPDVVDRATCDLAPAAAQAASDIVADKGIVLRPAPDLPPMMAGAGDRLIVAEAEIAIAVADPAFGLDRRPGAAADLVPEMGTVIVPGVVFPKNRRRENVGHYFIR